MNKKTFFIIPGFRENTKNERYRWLIKLLQTMGFTVISVPIEWHHRTLSDYAEQFKEFYKKHKTRTNIVLGFSFGAVTAFMTAQELDIDQLILCSLSSFFKEDMKMFKGKEEAIIHAVGMKRFIDAQKISSLTITKNLTVPTTFLYGEKEAGESPAYKKRLESLAKLAKRGKVIAINDAPHNISYPTYKKALELELKRISDIV